MDAARPLAGGLGNQGRVVRVGDTVRRPRSAQADAVAALLAHLEAVGFPAPVLAGRDEQGRDVHPWIEGEVALPPFPAWARPEAALASVGRLLRRLHDAAASFAAPAGAAWSRELADPCGGALVCHGDVCPENVVFRDGEAVALLDFDFAAPGRPVWDLAMTARLWIALLPGHAGRPFAGVPSRGLAVLAGAYGLPADDHRELVEAIVAAEEVGLAFVERRARAGDAAYVAIWERSVGGADGARRATELLARERDGWLAALALGA